jgi:hypothetical protein
MCAALAALSAAPLAGQRATEADSAQLRAYCQSAAKALAAGRSDPNYDWAVDQIMSCDRSAGPALATRWLSLREADRTELGHLIFSSTSVRDQRIFDAVLRVAGSRDTAPLIRLAALSVLASYTDPRVAAWPETLEHPDTSATLPLVLDFFPDSGAVPLAAGDPAAFMTLLRPLGESDPDPEVASAARYLRREFDSRGLGRSAP